MHAHRSWPCLLLLVWPLLAARAGPSVEAFHDAVAEADFGTARLAGRSDGFSLRGGEGGFRIGLDYAYTRYEYSDLASRDRDLHRLSVPMQWTHRGRWRFDLRLEPLMATSSNVFKDPFARADGDDFALYGRARVARRPDGRWGWQAGIARDDAFGRVLLYPELAATRDAARWGARLGWPRSWVEWRPVSDLGLRLAIAPAGARWHVVSDERDGADFEYRVEAWRSGLELRRAPGAGFSWRLAGGMEWARHQRLEDDRGIIVDADVDSAPYFRVEVGWIWGS